MTIVYGLTPTGFNTKTLSVIQDEIDAKLKTIPGIINVFPENITGQLRDTYAEPAALIWELLATLNASFKPDSAEGASLADILALTGNKFIGALPSTLARIGLFGTAATSVPAGTQFSVSGDTTIVFSTDSSVVLTAGTDAIQTLSFASVPGSGDFKLTYDSVDTAVIQFNATDVTIQTELRALPGLTDVTVAGDFTVGFTVTFTGADGAQEQPLLIVTDNTTGIAATVTETLAGVFQATVTCTATVTGAKNAARKTVTVIDTPVSGLDSVYNPEAAIPGRAVETDAEARVRRNDELVTSRAGPTAAIKAALLELNLDTTKVQLTDVRVFENFTKVTDSRGIPASAILAVVLQAGGSTARDQEIADVIGITRAGGIEPHGTVSKTVIDSEGVGYTVKFSRPVAVQVHLELDLTTDSTFPTNGAASVQNIMVNWGNSLGAGKSVLVFPELVAQLASTNIAGITDIVVRIGTAINPTLDANVVIDDGTVTQVEISEWDVSRVTVTIL